MKKLLLLCLTLISLAAPAQSGVATISVKLTNVATKTGVDSLKDELAKVKYNQAELAQLTSQIQGLSLRHDSLVAAFAGQDPKGIFKRYVPFPAAITPSSPVTITTSSTQCCGTGTFNFTLAGSAPKDIILDGNFTHGVAARQFDGTDTDHAYRFFNGAGAIMGGASGSEPGFSNLNSGNYQYIYGKSPTDPFVVKGERGLGGFNATVAGTVISIEHAVGKGNTAAFIQANGTTSGGSYYKSFTITFSSSYLSGQEGIAYLGRTSSGGAVHHRIYMTHDAAYSPFRDGWQIEPCDYFSVEHISVKDAGQRNGIDGSDQKNNFQIEAAHGHVKYGIYDNAVNLFTIFSNGDTISYNYISAELPGYIGKSSDLSYYFNSSGLNSHIDGTPIIIENNYIKCTGTCTYAMEIKEEVANVIIRNNVFQGYTTSYLDSRACLPSCSNTITGLISNNGNSSTTVNAPIWVTKYSDQDNYDQQMLLSTSSEYFNQHFGYRTP